MGKASRSRKSHIPKTGISAAGSRAASVGFPKTGYFQKTFIHIVLIAALGFIGYSNTFQSPFHWDDTPNIVENPVIKNLDNFLSSTEGFAYSPRRSIGYLTFALNYHFGGLQVTGYHVVNLFIHISNALLVYFLIILTFRTPFFKSEKLMVHSEKSHNSRIETEDERHPIELETSRFTIHDSRFTSLNALLSALLFVAHPIQTQAVTYVVQRFASLATLFYLLSILMYIKGRIAAMGAGQWAKKPAGDNGQTVMDKRPVVLPSPPAYRLLPATFYIFSLFFALLAMGTKEIAFTLPLVIALYEFSFFGSSLKKKLLFLLSFLFFLLIMVAVLMRSGKPTGELLSDVSEMTRYHTQMSRWDYLMTQMRVIVTYLRLIILPVNQNVEYDYPRYHSLFDAPVLLSCIFLSALFGTGVYFMQRSRQAGERKKGDGRDDSEFMNLALRLVAFGIFWFFITLSVESSIIPIVHVIFEHRVYLPSVGIFIGITGMSIFLARHVKVEKFVVSLLILIALLLSGATYARNTVWKSSISLWGDAIRKSPNKERPYNDRGVALGKIGQIDKAMEDFNKAISLNPSFAEAYNNRSTVYRMTGRIQEAIKDLNEAIRWNPSFAEAYNTRGVTFVQTGQFDKAIADFNRVIDLEPAFTNAYNNRGAAYGALGQYDKAMRDVTMAIKLNPSYADAYHTLGNVYLAQGSFDEAFTQFQATLRLNPEHGSARSQLEKITTYRKNIMQKER